MIYLIVLPSCSNLIFFASYYPPVFIFFFFFQAEDGIRDTSVTGVQTCALPISPRSPLPVTSSTASETSGARGSAALRAVRTVGSSNGRTVSCGWSTGGAGTTVPRCSSTSTALATYVDDSWYGAWKNTDQSLDISSRSSGSGQIRTTSSASARSLVARNGSLGGCAVAPATTWSTSAVVSTGRECSAAAVAPRRRCGTISSSLPWNVSR